MPSLDSTQVWEEEIGQLKSRKPDSIVKEETEIEPGWKKKVDTIPKMEEESGHKYGKIRKKVKLPINAHRRRI